MKQRGRHDTRQVALQHGMHGMERRRGANRRPCHGAPVPVRRAARAVGVLRQERYEVDSE